MSNFDMKEEDRVYCLEEHQFANAIKIAKDVHHPWLQGSATHISSRFRPSTPAAKKSFSEVLVNEVPLDKENRYVHTI
jgi:hypothetical protein